MKVGIIGAGRLGRSLALGLKDAGYRIEFLASKPPDDALKLCPELSAKLIHSPYNELDQVDLVFLTVPDDKIAMVAEELSQSLVDWSNKAVIHCSGTLTSEVLKPLKDKKAKVFSFHPLQTFPPGSGPEHFCGIYFAVEGDEYQICEQIARDLYAIPFPLKAENKVLYHAAATIASNYLFALASAATEVLKNAQIDSSSSLKILSPLMQGTLDSIMESGVKNGLTGPIARGDIEIVKKHLSELKPYPELELLYRILGCWILEIADLSVETRNKLESILII